MTCQIGPVLVCSGDSDDVCAGWFVELVQGKLGHRYMVSEVLQLLSM